MSNVILNRIFIWRLVFLLFCTLGVFAREIPQLDHVRKKTGGSVLEVDAKALQISFVSQPSASQVADKARQEISESPNETRKETKVEPKPEPESATRSEQRAKDEDQKVAKQTSDPQQASVSQSSAPESAINFDFAEAKQDASHTRNNDPSDVNPAESSDALDKPIHENSRTSGAPPTDVAGLQLEEIITQPEFRIPPSPPVYPPMARKRGHEGLVIIGAHVDIHGVPNKVEVISGSGTPSLDNAARQAVEKWRFVPPIRDGELAVSRIEIPIRFALK